jgi:hypothetical protein
MKHAAMNIAPHASEGKETGKMEQLPQWLTAAVDAAGITAFAFEGLEPKTLKHAPAPRPVFDDETPILPLH